MIFEKTANQSASDIISRTWISLRSTYEVMTGGASLDDLLHGLKEDIANNKISEELLNNYWLAHISSDPMNPTYPFTHACTLNELAQKALIDGDINKCWPLIVQASASAEGAAVHAFYNSKLDIVTALKRQRSDAGNKARNEKLQPAKDYVVKLIKDKRPREEWEDLTHAAQTIERDLIQFIDEHRPRLSLSKNLIVNTIKRWYKNDKKFRDSVNEVISQHLD